MQCSNCHAELETDLDIYGDIHRPLCRTCFLTGDQMSDTEYKDFLLKKAELEEEIEDKKAEIDSAEEELFGLRQELKEIIKKMDDYGESRTSPKGLEGLPISIYLAEERRSNA